MNWFEPSAFASLAKSAIKEAQKTIDKALDIREEEDKLPVIHDCKSQSIKKVLKEETESFFKAFEKAEEDNDVKDAALDEDFEVKDGTLVEGIQDSDSSQVDCVQPVDKSANDNTSKTVGSIWGSFTESFFENTIANAKDLVSSKSLKSNVVVETQPPRASVNQPSTFPSRSKLLFDNSPHSIIALQLASDVAPYNDVNIANSCLDKTINVIGTDSSKSMEFQASSSNWEWGLDNRSLFAPADEFIEGSSISKNDSTLLEECLVDDIIDTNNFAHSRLIVSSVDSDSSLQQYESQCSLNSNRSNAAEADNLYSVSEEVFFDPSTLMQLNIDGPSTNDLLTDVCSDYHSIDSNTSSSVQLLLVSNSDTSLECTDSIIVLNSSRSLSPLEVDKSVETSGITSPDSKPYNFFSTAPSSKTSPDSFEVIACSTTPSSPSSSVELLSPLSGESSSLAYQESCLSTITDNSHSNQPYYGKDDKTSESFPERTVTPTKILHIEEATEDDSEKEWHINLDEAEGFTITKQPISVTSYQKTKLGKEIEETLEGGVEIIYSHTTSFTSEEGSTSESIHSTSTSSTHTVIDNISSSQEIQVMNLSEISDRCDETILKTRHAEERSEQQKDYESLVSKTDENPFTLSSESSMSGKMMDIKTETENYLKCQDIGLQISQFCKVGNETPNESQELNLDVDKEFVNIHSGIDSTQGVGNETNSLDSHHLSHEVNAKSQGLYKEYSLDEVKADAEEKVCPCDLDLVLTERELSPSSSDRSDILKISSSGHSSADEVETATSSDIEVISSPSIDGSNGNSSQSYAASSGVASKVWVSAPKGFRSFISEKVELSSSSGANKKDIYLGKKGDAFPSSMATSFTSISESDGDCQQLSGNELLQLEASRITQVLLQDINLYGKGHHRNQSTLSETSESSSEPQSPEVDKLWKKINQLTDILEARETRVLELSHANIALLETNQTLKNRVDELEKLKIGSETSESMREEFTQRLVTMERKFQQALREKELAKKQLEESIAEAATRRSYADVTKELNEKEVIILELRQEGEKLSKQQLNYSNIIKKLRIKEKECETCIKDQKDKLESQASELDRLRKQLNAKDEVERCQIDAIRQLTVANQRQEVDLKDSAAEKAEAEGKLVALKEALDSAYREMTEMQRNAASKDAEVQEHTLSTEVAAREKVEAALTDLKKQNKREQEMLLAQIHELQDTLTLAETQANRKERQMKMEINELQQRLSDSESRVDDHSNSMGSATRSLLRQIDNLQNGHAAQQATWDSLEESLTKRLNEAQNSATLCIKKEREAKEQCSSLQSSISSLKFQVTNLTDKNAKLQNEFELINEKISELEEEKAKDVCQLEALKKSFVEKITEVKRERDIFEQQLEIEKLALNSEKKKSNSLIDQLKDKDRKLIQIQLAIAASESKLSTPRSSPTPSLSRLSISGSVHESFSGSHWGDDVFDPSWTSARGGSVYDTLRGNSAITVDLLTSTLKQKEGELHYMQNELMQLEGQKESLAQELVQTSRKVDELTNQMVDYDKIKGMFLDLEQKYNALLQMHGEKVEEVEELRLDLVDVKEMYKLQIDQLMQR